MYALASPRKSYHQLEFSDLTADNNQRPPDWRWQRALQLFNGQHRVVFKKEDPLVQMVYRYQAYIRGNIVDPDGPHRIFPVIHDVARMAADSTPERWILEAMIMGRDSVEDIAAYFGHKVELVRTFEDCFFDVRSRLDNPGYVQSQLLLAPGPRGLDPEDTQQIYRQIAFYGGVENLKAYLGTGPMTPETRRWFEDASRGEQAKKRLAAESTLKIAQDNSLDVIRLGIERDKLTLKEKTEGVVDNGIAKLAWSAGLSMTVANLNNIIYGKDEPTAADQTREQLAAVGIVANAKSPIPGPEGGNPNG